VAGRFSDRVRQGGQEGYRKHIVLQGSKGPEDRLSHVTTASKPISFELNAKVPAGVQVREIDGEAILLNLDSGLYFGLNATGSRFLADVTRFETIERAFEDLLETYDAEPEELRAALSELLAELVENGLIELSAR